jgi:uncharacterized protein YjiS (DUF1127 family)
MEKATQDVHEGLFGMKQFAQASPVHFALLPRVVWQHVCWLTMRMRAWKLRRDASRQLLELSDAHLKDIGLHRSEVYSRLIEIDTNRWRRADSAAGPKK